MKILEGTKIGNRYQFYILFSEKNIGKYLYIDRKKNKCWLVNNKLENSYKITRARPPFFKKECGVCYFSDSRQYCLLIPTNKEIYFFDTLEDALFFAASFFVAYPDKNKLRQIYERLSFIKPRKLRLLYTLLVYFEIFEKIYDIEKFKQYFGLDDRSFYEKRYRVKKLVKKYEIIF